MKFKNALVSCSDKSGLLEFLKPFEGLRIVSTGGTAKYLRQNGFEVVDVSEQTGFQEVMEGRVKTLHPLVHMGLLARAGIDDSVLSDAGIEAFDLVVVNLYPFESALRSGKIGDELIEFIDVGGPSMLRAAAKNFNRVTVLCDPKDYDKVDQLTPKELAAKVFRLTSSYDALIAESLSSEPQTPFVYGAEKVLTLRYGENPHQKGVWYKKTGVDFGLHQAQILQGKELSYNNLLDLDSSTRALRDLKNPFGCVAVKHNSPCGAAAGENLFEACKKALAADPVSVFGGIVALSQKVDLKTAKLLSEIFLECVIAPDFDQDALDLFRTKKNLRILKWAQMANPFDEWRIKSISGGMVIQNSDRVHHGDWQYWGETPSAQMTKELLFAWSICAHLKSNAIAITSELQTLGLGMGQVNRVDAVEQAILRYKKFHPEASTPVLASDAFFPFSDSIEKIADAGIRWVIQPGGSIKDDSVRAMAEQRGVSVVITGQRHFLH